MVLAASVRECADSFLPHPACEPHTDRMLNFRDCAGGAMPSMPAMPSAESAMAASGGGMVTSAGGVQSFVYAG